MYPNRFTQAPVRHPPHPDVRFSSVPACGARCLLQVITGRNNSWLKQITTQAALLLFSVSSLPCLLMPWLLGRRLERFVNSLLLLMRELRPADQRGASTVHAARDAHATAHVFPTSNLALGAFGFLLALWS